MFNNEQRRVWAALQIGPLYEGATADTAAASAPSAAASVEKAAIDFVPAPRHTSAPVLSADATEESVVAISPLAQSWDELEQQVSQCKRCNLCQSRTQTVFAAGRPGVALMIIGEAPGEEEDRLGQPFVGQSGKLLDNMLTQIGLNRARDVVIANALKCRPPANRNPSVEELAACRPYLLQQLELVRPKVLLLSGKFAAQAILGSDAAIATLRAQQHHYALHDATEVPAMVTYHPAYYLRRPTEKSKGWADLMKLRQLLLSSQTPIQMQ
jgi:uracil-DNA glycosylase